MHLVRIARGSHWTVYAICADAITCPLLDFVAELDLKRSAKVMSDLREFVPHSTSKQWVAMDFSWHLRNTDVLEFRWPTKQGGTPRVYWFYDGDRLVVCSHGVNKKGDTDPQDIKEAERKKKEYLKCKAARQLNIIELEDFGPPDEEEENG